jgi:drug/metabolite transporter (DMT)-like permease
MLQVALALILAAAFLHAGWNVIAKSSKNTPALMWWASLLGTAGYGAWVLSTLGIYMNTASRLPFIISAVAETGYFVTLVRGYAQGDLSQVYPLSRGSAPIFVAVWSALILEERLPPLGYAGIGLIVAGICIVSIPFDRSLTVFLRRNVHTHFHLGAIGWALASGVFISIYSITDKIAVAATPPLVYNWWVFAGNTVLWAPVVWRKPLAGTSFDEFRRNWRAAIAAGVAMVAAYAAALSALTLTSASYVVAGRGLSLVIAAVIGSVLLKENFGLSRTVGAVLMVAGLTMIAFA